MLISFLSFVYSWSSFHKTFHFYNIKSLKGMIEIFQEVSLWIILDQYIWYLFPLCSVLIESINITEGFSMTGYSEREPMKIRVPDLHLWDRTFGLVQTVEFDFYFSLYSFKKMTTMFMLGRLPTELVRMACCYGISSSSTYSPWWGWCEPGALSCLI